jgi:hypothetical protein
MPKSSIAHVKERAKQRFNFNLSRKDIRLLAAQIRNKDFVLSFDVGSNDAKGYVVYFEGKYIPVVYVEALGTIITVLPENCRELDFQLNALSFEHLQNILENIKTKYCFGGKIKINRIAENRYSVTGWKKTSRYYSHKLFRPNELLKYLCEMDRIETKRRQNLLVSYECFHPNIDFLVDSV